MAYVDSADLAGTGASQGAAMVGFKQPATGSVPLTVDQTLGNVAPLTPEDFGAVGYGTAGTARAGTDATAAIQAMLDAMIETGKPGFFRQFYKVTGNVRWRRAGNSQAPVILGSGAFSSGLVPVGVDNEAVLTIDGSSLDDFRFAISGRLAAFGIFPGYVDDVGSAGGYSSSGTNTIGIELIGYLFGKLDQVRVEGVTGNAIDVPLRTDIDTNPDGYTTAAIIDNCWLTDNGGWGVHGANGLGFLANLQNSYVVRNDGGGVLISGGANVIRNNSIAFNGSSGSGHGGLYVKYVGGHARNLIVAQNEFDSNYAYNVWIEGLVRGDLTHNRSLHTEYVHQDGTTRPPVGFKLGFNPSAAVSGIRAWSNFVRSKNAALALTTPDTAITAWQLDSGTARLRDIYIDGTYFQAGANSLNFVAYATGGDALLTPTFGPDGAITGATVVRGGSGYVTGEVTVVAVDPAGTGGGFEGTVTVSGGAVTGISVTSDGSDYSTGPLGTYLVIKPVLYSGLNANDRITIDAEGLRVWSGGQSPVITRAIAAQNVSTTAATKLTFESEESDWANWHNPSAGEITLTEGQYVVDATITTDLTRAGQVRLYAKLDGATVLTQTSLAPCAGVMTHRLSGGFRVGATTAKLTIHADQDTCAAKALSGGVTANRLLVMPCARG